MFEILLILALALFVIDAVTSLRERTITFFRGTGLQSAGLACLAGALLVESGFIG